MPSALGLVFECQPGDTLSINSAKQGEVCDEELVKLSRFAFLKLKLFHASWVNFDGNSAVFEGCFGKRQRLKLSINLAKHGWL